MDENRHSAAGAASAGGGDGPEGGEVGEALPGAVTRGSAAIATTLQKAILEGSYAYGERLPQLAVVRSVVLRMTSWLDFILPVG